MSYAILVVDDEAASLRTVRRALGDEFRLWLAESPPAALEILAREPVAAALVDHRMPGMTGIELLECCAAQHPDVLRLLFTGYSDFDTLMAAVNAGHVFSYIRKPWEPHDLRLTVRRAVERHAVEADRRRLLGLLQDSCSRLERETEARARLLTLAAHELGTPLHLIASALPWWREPADAADIARRGVDWLGRAVAQLHLAGQWHDAALPMDCRPFSVAAAVATVLAAHGPAVTQRELHLESAVASDLPDLVADRSWIERALGNLISNAIRATPDGGHIVVFGESSGGGIRLRVEDDGIGIEARWLPRLFDPFTPAAGDINLHGSGRFEFGARGLGLGLSIVERVARSHGGTVGVTSAPGRGSCFELQLPVDSAL